jgi:hypothetical protein
MAPEKGALLLRTAGLWSGKACGEASARAVRLRRRRAQRTPFSGMVAKEGWEYEASVSRQEMTARS